MITKQSKIGNVVEIFVAKTKEGFDLCSSEYEKDDEIRSIHATGLTQNDIKEMIYSLQLLLKNKIDTTHIPKWGTKWKEKQ